MNCNEVRQLIDAYIDGELDLVNSLAVERHLQNCPVCARFYANHSAVRTATRSSSLYFTAPPRLHKELRTALRREAHTGHGIPPVMRWLSLAAALIATVILTVGLSRGALVPAGDEPLIQEVIASHVRSLMANHLADVTSSDQHTVKPWFNGKLDFSPNVVDLANQGFPLIGGRLDYLDNRAVAALVYHHQQHYINVFIWPSANDGSTVTVSRQGYHVIHWNQSGMVFWVVSDLNVDELQQFVRLLQSQAGPTP